MSWTSSLDQCLWCSFTPLPLTILLIANVSMPSCRPTLRGERGGRNCPNNAFWDIPPNITEKMSLQITFSCSSDNTLACDCAVFTCKESLLCSNIVLLCSTNLKIITQPHVTSWVYKARVNKKKGIGMGSYTCICQLFVFWELMRLKNTSDSFAVTLISCHLASQSFWTFQRLQLLTFHFPRIIGNEIL